MGGAIERARPNEISQQNALSRLSLPGCSDMQQRHHWSNLVQYFRSHIETRQNLVKNSNEIVALKEKHSHTQNIALYIAVLLSIFSIIKQVCYRYSALYNSFVIDSQHYITVLLSVVNCK